MQEIIDMFMENKLFLCVTIFLIVGIAMNSKGGKGGKGGKSTPSE